MKRSETTRPRYKLLRALVKCPDHAHVNFVSFALGLGIRRQNLTIYLNELRNDGVIRTSPTFGGSTIEILNRPELERRLGETEVGGKGRLGDVGRGQKVRGPRPVSVGGGDRWA